MPARYDLGTKGQHGEFQGPHVDKLQQPDLGQGRNLTSRKRVRFLEALLKASSLVIQAS